MIKLLHDDGRQLQNIYHQKEKWVLTTPLIEGNDGRKMI
jgi:tyrosyl-tRNA synthetase